MVQHRKSTAPDLQFRVEGVEVLEYAAIPTLLFRLGIENAGVEPVRSVALRTQIRIAPAQRHYKADEQERLREVFGEASRWGETLKGMLWTHTAVQVPAFSGSIVVDMPVHCTYDFDVVSTKYFHNLEDGEIPLEFLFSGTVFYAGDMGLQVAQISWDKEAPFRMPVRVWKEVMAHYFPNSAWLRIQTDTFDRLYGYKTRKGLPTWEAALERLLRESEEGEG